MLHILSAFYCVSLLSFSNAILWPHPFLYLHGTPGLNLAILHACLSTTFLWPPQSSCSFIRQRSIDIQFKNLESDSSNGGSHAEFVVDIGSTSRNTISKRNYLIIFSPNPEWVISCVADNIIPILSILFSLPVRRWLWTVNFGSANRKNL